jgi:aquaporin Z
MNVSGGHLNPAVTLTMYVLGKIDTAQMVYYITFQLLGGIIAGFFLTVIFGGTVAATDQAVALGTPHIGGLREVYTSRYMVLGFLDQTLVMAIVVEMVLTFILVFAFFGTAVDPRAPNVGGFGIGLAVACDILVGGPLTGAAMNPARYFGTGLWEAGINQNGLSRLSDFAVYIVGPVLGGILAGWVYTKFVLPTPSAVEKK